MKKFGNPQLQKRYENDTDFRNKVIMSQQEYYLLRKKANQLRPDQIINESFLEKFINDENLAVYFIYGHMQPPPGKSTGNFTLNFLLNFKPEPDENFAFVYFNYMTPSSDYFKEFKNIFMLLPLTILEKMNAFVLVKPTFYLRAINFITFNSSDNIFKKVYYTVDTCHQLCEKLRISIKQFVSFVPEQYSQQFPQKFKRNVSLQNYRVNLTGQDLTQSQRWQKHEFQQQINALISKEVYRIQNYEIGELGIPVVLQMLIFYFKGNAQGLSEEGIFRKSVSVDQQKQTFLQLSKRNYQYLQNIKNPYLIASLIKKFFNNLKEPIITFPIFMQLMNDQAIADKRQHLKKLTKQLPKLNFDTLGFLIDFLKKQVIIRQKQNKMSANNIAICFSPCLMRSEIASIADLAYATKSVVYCNILINDFDYIFGSEQERSLVFKTNIKQHNKIFQQTVMQELKFDEQDERPPTVTIRPTMSYVLNEQGCIQELEKKEDIYQKVEKKELKQQSHDRKISDKIEQVSTEIRDIQRRFKQEKSSVGSEKQFEAYMYNPNNADLEMQTTTIQIEPQQEEIPDINPSLIAKSKFQVNYANPKTSPLQLGQKDNSNQIQNHKKEKSNVNIPFSKNQQQKQLSRQDQNP